MKVNLGPQSLLNTNVINNYSKLKPSLFFLPIFLLITIVLFLYNQGPFNVDHYTQIQKNHFFFLNSKLSQFPNTQYNLTQLGDALILLPFFTIFIVYAPKIWESLLSASLVSSIFSWLLKAMFSVPRPAAVFDNNSFVIIGKALYGNTSLPSGHSITIFTTFTVLLFAFMPKQFNYKILCILLVIIIGLILVLTRVGVGAHYPIDVIVGS